MYIALYLSNTWQTIKYIRKLTNTKFGQEALTKSRMSFTRSQTLGGMGNVPPIEFRPWCLLHKD